MHHLCHYFNDNILFLSIPDIMKQFEHPHVIKLIGVVTSVPIYIIMELAPFGEVK